MWFVLTEAAVYAGFLLADACELYSFGTGLKYAGILLCVLYAFCAHVSRRVTLALMLTAAADLFLLVLGRYLEWGVLLFIGVQTLYARQIARDTKGTLALRVVLVLAFWCVLWGLDMTEPLYLLVGIYFPQLVCNAILAYRKDKLFALGLTLFIACDISVGLWNLIGIGGTAMWAFYLPSQVLIALSGAGLKTDGKGRIIKAR